MKKHIYIFIMLSIFAGAEVSIADAKFQLEKVNNTESLPRIEIPDKSATDKEFKPITPKTEHIQQKRPGFNPKKNSGMTNYQYDDTYYKYNKYEKYVKDNIEYSKSGSTKLY